MLRRWLAGVCLLLATAEVAQGQRIQFPSPVAPDSPFYTPPQIAAPGDLTAPAVTAPDVAPPSISAPTLTSPPPPALTAPPPPAGQWDPYADAAPGAAATPLYPPDGYIQPGASTRRSQRLIQEIGVEQAWLARLRGRDSLGLQTVDLWATGAIPFLWNESPLLITPGFAFHFWDGPETLIVPEHPDLPPRTYDAYLDANWKPRFNQNLSADLDVRVGVYSDFNRVNAKSIRVTGRGLALLSFSPTVQLAVGVVYVNRGNVKLLPAGGVIYTPNSDTRFDLVFPNPKISHRFRTVGNTDLWWYATGRYGGGMWTISRASGDGDRFTYNDIRVAGGVEFLSFKGLRGWVDVGYVWDREVIYVSNAGSFTPDDTVAITAGLAY